jgi:hypothetical protein
MSEGTLKYMADLMARLEIPYEFLRWNSGIPPDYYFVGDYIEEESLTKEENGFQRSTFILRGYTRQSAMLLERAKAKIEKNACKTAILPDGTGIAVFYATGGYVPTGDAELKSIKINLTIQEWRVN